MLICQLPQKSLYLNQTLLNNNSNSPSSSTIHPPPLNNPHTLNKKMTDIVLHSPPQLPSSSSSIINCSNNDDLHQQPQQQQTTLHYHLINSRQIQGGGGGGGGGERVETEEEERERDDEVSVLAVLVTVFRKSLVGCKSSIGGENSNSGFEEKKKLMEISWPTNVKHVAHVTFDRFNGFLGLPVEFEPEVPRRPPSASTRVFGVSTKSMQLSFDSRGNCVPTILLMMQRRLYSQGGLQYEGIFRINPENGQEEYVREQLNNGVIPENIDVHCLAGLIKAWFRELPSGILDSLPPEEVMEAESEEECTRLVRLLPPTEAALLDWAINLMADVAQLESSNKMNARNIAMVFAPNMTQMLDPLTALMYAVQVMNFLKTLIVKTLRGRQDSLVEPGPKKQTEPSDEDGHHSALKPINLETNEEEEEEEEQDKLAKEAESSQNHSSSTQSESRTRNDDSNFLSSIENILSDENGDRGCNNSAKSQPRSRRTRNGGAKKGSRKQSTAQTVVVHVDDDQSEEKNKEPSIISRVNSHAERVEVWR